MNDRFKFRVWSKQYGRYIQDNECPIGGDYSLSMTQYGYIEVIGFGDYEEGSDTTHTWGCVKNLREYIGECIIEQCTGLKDKNGKLIYEGDVLGGIYGLPIKWCDKEKSFELFFEDDCMSCGGDVLWSDVVEDDGKLEVIGNIHEVQDEH